MAFDFSTSLCRLDRPKGVLVLERLSLPGSAMVEIESIYISRMYILSVKSGRRSKDLRLSPGVKTTFILDRENLPDDKAIIDVESFSV